VEPKAAHLPTGTVTFLFSDIEGSTVRWHAHRAERVRRHDQLMRAAIVRMRETGG
jgi:class 3 adenylate cyclase